MKVRNPLRPGRMVKDVRAVSVDDLFYYSEELGLDISEPVRFLFDREWLHYRTAATIQFPFFNTSMGRLEKGRSCRGCHEAFQTRLVLANGPLGNGRINVLSGERDRCYSHRGFQDHFETCEHAQRIWLSRALPGREAWFAANGGMYWGISERAEYCQRFTALIPAVNNEAF
ncbi:hypothetical protein FAGAP_1208 [Fusarium agapanthi]|uniref:Uncharacterized protein n=1 Tax=Fusarium agapanthi TaxID=1803897 RepID=A0A9P5EBA3_9HYPO|nr:hypothetical protein FAGAP_1208 [Fusarium agapanthi]